MRKMSTIIKMRFSKVHLLPWQHLLHILNVPQYTQVLCIVKPPMGTGTNKYVLPSNIEYIMVT